MRLSQNEIIQAQRRAERNSTLARAINIAFRLTPRPIQRWALLRLLEMATKAMLRRGYSQDDVIALFEAAVRKHKRDDA